MPALATILCPVDLSDISARALAWAVRLAQRHGGHVHVTEVLDLALSPVPGEPFVIALPDEVKDRARRALATFAQPAIATGRATVSVCEGPVVEEVLRQAEALAADLIVMGTHGRGGFERLALGSVAEKILRRAPCPVLAVPPASAPEPHIPFRTVLCPTDFSEASTAAAVYARDLARDESTTLTLLHVFEWALGDVHDTGPIETLKENLRADAQDRLDRLAAAVAAGGTPPTTLLVEGKPRRVIPAVAQDQQADLIVMGLSGRGAIDRAVLGSTTHHVIREGVCPVLTVPGEAQILRRRRAGAAGAEPVSS